MDPVTHSPLLTMNAFFFIPKKGQERFQHIAWEQTVGFDTQKINYISYNMLRIDIHADQALGATIDFSGENSQSFEMSLLGPPRKWVKSIAMNITPPHRHSIIIRKINDIVLHSTQDTFFSVKTEDNVLYTARIEALTQYRLKKIADNYNLLSSGYRNPYQLNVNAKLAAQDFSTNNHLSPPPPVKGEKRKQPNAKAPPSKRLKVLASLPDLPSEAASPKTPREVQSNASDLRASNDFFDLSYDP